LHRGINIAAYLRSNASRTNERVTHFGNNLGARLETREQPVACDLAIQAGFQISPAMADAMARGIPIIILENPVWHYGDKLATYSWGYNGLNGLGMAPSCADKESRPHPALGTPRDPKEGVDIIFGQVPDDKALRGKDNDEWIAEELRKRPTAEVRPHPVTIDHRFEEQEPFESVMARCGRAITYSSTVGAEALIRGIETIARHPGSWAYDVQDREEWIKDLSWRHWSTDEEIDVDWILGGYEEALELSRAGYYDNMSNGRD